MSNPKLRSQVINLYKTLLYLGKEYPKGYTYFRDRCKTAFMKNKDKTDEEEIKMLIARGKFVEKELEALYMLRKYRTLKKRYYE
uniref:LYR motif-containing protein 5A n=1 Tax=Magallana gigas TaxID=29159 RepID=K1QUB7_MAGGI